MSATTGTPSVRPSVQFVHVSEIRKAFDAASDNTIPALFMCDSGALDIPVDDYLGTLTPVNAYDVMEAGATIDATEVHNGEWYDLSDVLANLFDTFDTFGEQFERVDYPVYYADIERVRERNDDEIEEAFAELVAEGSLDTNCILSDVIRQAVYRAIESAYGVDILAFAEQLMHELERVDTIGGVTEY